MDNKLYGGDGEDCLDAGIGNTISSFTRVQDCGGTSYDYWVDRGVGHVDCDLPLTPPSPTETVPFCQNPEATW